MRLLGTCLLLLVLLTGCKEVLYDNLSQREANKLVTTLRQSDIEAERVDEGDGMFSVLVERNRFAEAVTLLEQRGLPRERFDTMADVFTSDSLLSTPLEERARLAYALSQELMRSLTAVDGILDAHVHLTLSRELPLSNEATPATASVLLNHAPGFDIEALIPDVKFLVAQGVPNLSYRDVSVVTAPERLWEVPAVQAATYSSFLGIRFVDEDANKFALLMACLAAFLVFLIVIFVFVISRSSLVSQRESSDTGAVTHAAVGENALGRLLPRWANKKTPAREPVA